MRSKVRHAELECCTYLTSASILLVPDVPLPAGGGTTCSGRAGRLVERHDDQGREDRAAEPARGRAPWPTGADLVYFSSVSGNTRRFVEKLGLSAARIPLRPRLEGSLLATQPFVLIVPTYGSGRRSGAVPKQVIHFLNDPEESSPSARRDRRREHQLRTGLLPRGAGDLREVPGPRALSLRTARHPRRCPPRRGGPRPLLGGLRARRARGPPPSRVRLIHPLTRRIAMTDSTTTPVPVADRDAADVPARPHPEAPPDQLEPRGGTRRTSRCGIV